MLGGWGEVTGWSSGRQMREDLKEEGGGLSSEPPRCLLQLPVQDASGRPDWPDRKSPASAGNCGGGRKGHVTSTHHQLFPNLVSTARLAPGSFPSFPRFQGRLVLQWGRRPRGRVTDSQADLRLLGSDKEAKLRPTRAHRRASPLMKSTCISEFSPEPKN